MQLKEGRTDPKGFNIPIKTNSGLPGAVPAGTKIYAKVEPTKLIPNCSGIQAVGEFVQGSDIKASGNYLTVPVEVKSPGKASIELKSEADGFVFKSEEINFNFNAATNNIVEVILKPESQVIPFGKVSSSFKFTTSPDLELSNCTTDFVLNFEQPAVDYEIVDCKDIMPQRRNFPGRKGINDDKFDIKVKVLVKIAGPYTITASTINGPSFVGTGQFQTSDQGKSVTVSLKANGQFDVDTTKSTTFTYSIATGPFTSNTCTFSVTAGLPDIHVLRYTNGNGARGKSTNISNLLTAKNYGLNGRLSQVASIRYSEIVIGDDVTGNQEKAKPAKQRAEELRKYIEDNDVNVVLMDYDKAVIVTSLSAPLPDTYYVEETDGSFPILKTVVDLLKERKIALGYFNDGTKLTTFIKDNIYLVEERNSEIFRKMMQYITDQIYPELPKSEVPNFYYTKTRHRDLRTYTCNADEFFTLPSSLKGSSPYLTPDYLDPTKSKLTASEQKNFNLFDKPLWTPQGRITYKNQTSDKFIPLTQLHTWESGAQGYIFFTVKDYAFVGGNATTFGTGYYQTNGNLRDDITVYDWDCNEISRIVPLYAGTLYTALLTGLIEDVKKGL